jgi:hypothetical protein
MAQTNLELVVSGEIKKKKCKNHNCGRGISAKHIEEDKKNMNHFSSRYSRRT